MCWHVSARHLSFHCSGSRLPLMKVNHTQNMFAINQYTDYENKNCGCPLLALLLFIDSVHLHLLPKPNFTIRQLSTSRCTKKKLIQSSTFCMCVFKLAPALAVPNFCIFYIKLRYELKLYNVIYTDG